MIAESLPDAAVMIDIAGRIIWANRAAERLFRVQVEAIVGADVLDFVHPDDVQLAALSMTSVQSKEVGTLIELRARVDGAWHLVEVVGAPIDGSILMTIRDLTERRRWEVAGDETARFRSILQNAPSLLFLVSASGVVRGSSGALTRLLGHDQEWLEQRSLLDLVACDQRELVEGALAEVGDAGQGHRAPLTVDVALRHLTGEHVPVALTFVSLLDDPTVEGLVVTGHDITDRLRIEEALRHANSQLLATLESTADAILVVDLDGRITTFNDNFVKLWGLPRPMLEAGDQDQVFVAAARQLVDQPAFAATARDLSVHVQARSVDTLEFTDGRVVERNSLPQWIDGRIVGRVWSFRDVTANRQLERQLIHQAFHDPLTGLANRALFHDRVAQAIAGSARRHSELAVLFIDLDSFKTVNDSLGHTAGDQLLIAVSERLRQCVRRGDSIARLGGDEFAVLIDGFDGADTASTIAQRMVEVMHEPFAIDHRHVAATASIGIAYHHVGTSAEDLLRSADMAMYSAKADGKNCIAVFSPRMHRAAVQRLDLEEDLRRAVARREFVVHYQPVIELRTGSVHGFEALVRWAHPDGRLRSPAEFISAAESGPLIDQINDHVAATACAQLAEWNRGRAPLTMAINVSAHQLRDETFPTSLASIIVDKELDPSWVTLEITERTLMREQGGAAQQLRRLRQLGVRIGIDDFGTGYSSLSYLQQFQVDVLKIDQSFIAEIATHPRVNLTAAIVNIAHTLGLVPIAEGVEDEAQAQALRELGCDLAQGFYLGPPVDAVDASRLLVR